MGKQRILVVDDDRDILDLLEYNLEREGFKVHTIATSSAAVGECIAFEPHLIILDIMMPDLNGIELCRHIRAKDKFKDTFIFFLSAKSESYYQEAAFDTGGDDYIEKIDGLRSLTGKIKTVLRLDLVIRKRVREIHLGSLHINRREGSARLGSREMRLTKPEFELLFFLAQNPCKLVSTGNILTILGGSETFSQGGSIDLYIDLLTQKLHGQWEVTSAGGKYGLTPVAS